jgi:hypothetical protein
MILDAQAALGFVVSQTAHIEPEVYNTRYPDIQYPGLIPVDMSAHPWAQNVVYYSSDKAGEAAYLNGNADDVPLVSGERTKHSTAVHMAGIGYAFGLEEISHAQMLGINLPADDAMAARRAYEQMVDNVSMTGNTEKGQEGLFDYTGVPQVAATNGDWTNGSRTEDQILKDINDGLAYVHITATNTVAMADTLLLPWSRYHLISTTRLGDTTMTILEFIRKNNVYTATTGQPLNIRGMRGLDTMSGSGEPRMICYRNSREVLKLHIPMPHRFLPVFQASSMRWEVPGIFRLGGLDIRLPKEVAYIEGI